jgi:uncharacterized NAD(P)/FAD-binding protein YdhS
MKSITIVGGGGSGTLLAVNLLRAKTTLPIHVNLVEKNSRLCKGVAFSTSDDVHLLNVPTAKMGAFPDDVGHFHRWLNDSGYTYEPTDFVPRRLFAEYLSAVLSDAIVRRPSNITFEQIDDEAVEVTSGDQPAEVVTAMGQRLASDLVVLAFGNFLPPDPAVPDLSYADSDKYFRDVWAPGIYDRLDPHDRVLIIGTGLSMVDVVMKLEKLDHRGEIIAVSTRGLLPAVHKLGFEYPTFNEELAGSTKITDIFTKVRRHIQAATESGSDWRAVIDGLRPVTHQIWQDLPIEEKRYFLQHLSRYWNVARHRIPPRAAMVIDELRGAGQLQVLRGRLKNIRVTEEGCFLLRYLDMGKELSVNADAIFNCIGSEANFSNLDSPLLTNLYESGAIRNSELRIGLDATPDGRLLNADGEINPSLYTLGTALKGILWESTAIPEIRSQARDLAQQIIADA